MGSEMCIRDSAGGEKRAGGWTWSYSVVARGAGRQHEAGEKEKQAH